MPRITIPTGFSTENGHEEVLAEYLCDVAGCPNPATEVMGFVREFGGGFAVCAEHAGIRRTDSVDHHR